MFSFLACVTISPCLNQTRRHGVASGRSQIGRMLKGGCRRAQLGSEGIGDKAFIVLVVVRGGHDIVESFFGVVSGGAVQEVVEGGADSVTVREARAARNSARSPTGEFCVFLMKSLMGRYFLCIGRVRQLCC